LGVSPDGVVVPAGGGAPVPVDPGVGVVGVPPGWVGDPVGAPPGFVAGLLGGASGPGSLVTTSPVHAAAAKSATEAMSSRGILSSLGRRSLIITFPPRRVDIDGWQPGSGRRACAQSSSETRETPRDTGQRAPAGVLEKFPPDSRRQHS